MIKFATALYVLQKKIGTTVCNGFNKILNPIIKFAVINPIGSYQN